MQRTYKPDVARLKEYKRHQKAEQEQVNERQHADTGVHEVESREEERVIYDTDPHGIAPRDRHHREATAHDLLLVTLEHIAYKYKNQIDYISPAGESNRYAARECADADRSREHNRTDCKTYEVMLNRILLNETECADLPSHEKHREEDTHEGRDDGAAQTRELLVDHRVEDSEDLTIRLELRCKSHGNHNDTARDTLADDGHEEDRECEKDLEEQVETGLLAGGSATWCERGFCSLIDDVRTVENFLHNVSLP